LKSDPCQYCHFAVPNDWTSCPHCPRPSRFPNVLQAVDPEERQALDSRYQQARQDAVTRGAHQILQQFETALQESEAVINRPFAEVARLAKSDKQLYATYYQLTQLRIPAGDKWDTLRSIADAALFGDRVKTEIRFAALTLDGEGLTNYGNCSIVMKEEMIAHRASVFHENSVMFMKNREIKIGDAPELPRGYRAAWNDRHRICATKLANRLDSATPPADFPKLLLKPGTSETDEFVEVHIFGSLTVRTFARVIVRLKNRQPKKSLRQSLEAELSQVNVALEVRE
jgi:hypothetical protein